MALGDDTEALRDAEAVGLMITRWVLRTNAIASGLEQALLEVISKQGISSTMKSNPVNRCHALFLEDNFVGIRSLVMAVCWVSLGRLQCSLTSNRGGVYLPKT